MMEPDDWKRMMELYDKPSSETFTNEELEFLKRVMPKKNFKAKYGIYRQQRYNGLYLAFIIDSFPRAIRKPAFFQGCEVICERELTDNEWIEELQNWGTSHRTLTVWNYLDTEYLIEEDLKYGIKTPKRIIDEFKYRKAFGFTKEQQKERRRSQKERIFRTIP